MELKLCSWDIEITYNHTHAHTHSLAPQELEKQASRKLRINAKETMRIAEKLYTQGYISYPRTETNIFPPSFDLAAIVRDQMPDPQWGAFANQILMRGPTPRQGNKTDNAHPPIHPTKYTNTLTVIDSMFMFRLLKWIKVITL